MNKKLIALLLCLMMVLTMVVSVSALSTVKITGVKLDKASVTLDVGQSYSLKYTLTPADTTQKTLVFSTSDKNVASIDATGNITAVGAGKATVTATSSVDSKISAKCTVTVNKKAQESLTVEVYDRGTTGQTPPDNNYWTDWIQKNFGDKNNIKLKFVTCPRFDNEAKIQIWMASGTAPDVSITYDINVCYNFYKNGGLTDLTSAMSQYGQDLKTFLGQDVLSRGLYKQRQYLIPARRIIVAKENTWIRKDWLDALGLSIPTTRDEWYADMKLFKAKNPGKGTKVIPYGMGQDVGWNQWNLLESFKTDKSETTRFLTNQRYMQMFAPGYKDGLKFLNKMYNEGLVSPEFALDKDGKMGDADFINGYVGSGSGNYDYPLRAVPGQIAGLKKTVPTENYIPIDPFKDKDGVTTKTLYDPAGIRIFVPKTSESKANSAIKYLNWMTDKDVLFFLQYGDEGVNHTTSSDGFPVYQKVTGEKTMDSTNNIDLTLIVNGVFLGDSDKTLKLNSLAYGQDANLFIQAFNTSMANGYVEPALAVPLDAEAKYGNALQVKGYEVYAKVITCAPEDFENTWNQMYNEYARAGGAAVMSARRAAWNADHK